MKNMALKGKGRSEEKCCVKIKGGGGHQIIPPNFAVTAFVIIYFYCKQPTRMPKTSVSDIQKVQIFPGKHAPGSPTL